MARDIDANRRYGEAWLARVRFDQGRWQDAEDLIEPDPSECHVCSIVRETVRGRLLARQGRAGADAALAVAWERATQTQDIQRLWPAVAGRVELAWLTSSLGTEVVADLTAVLDMADGRGMPHALGELGWWAWKLGVRSGPLPEEAAAGYRLHVAGDLAGAAAAWDARGGAVRGRDGVGGQRRRGIAALRTRSVHRSRRRPDGPTDSAPTA